MLFGIDTILREARKRGYAVGGFTVNNMETAKGVLDAAVEKRSPVIVAFAMGGIFDLLPTRTLVAAMRSLAESTDVPVAVALDHGRSFEDAMQAIHFGATSVMYDGSQLPLDENIRCTCEVVKAAHALGVAVEAALGRIGSGADYSSLAENRETWFTRLEEAEQFVRSTLVDALGVAVGTAHGPYAGGSAEIDYGLLGRLRASVSVPLVLHGGSATGETKLEKAIACGISKVNIYTDMASAAKQRAWALLSSDLERVQFSDLLFESQRAFRAVSARYMDVFGSSGKA